MNDINLLPETVQNQPERQLYTFNVQKVFEDTTDRIGKYWIRLHMGPWNEDRKVSAANYGLEERIQQAKAELVELYEVFARQFPGLSENEPNSHTVKIEFQALALEDSTTKKRKSIFG